MAGRRDEGGYLTARVIEANRLSPSLIRVVFDASDARGFESSGVPDEIVHLYFPAVGEDVPPEMIRRDGVLAHHDDVVRECRNYTVRRWDGDRITIDFVDHVGGVAADWARSAEPGTALGMWGTRSWYEPPADTEWMLLIADLPGLPALCRALEQLPAGLRAHAIVEVAHDNDVLDVRSAASVTMDWRVAGNGRAPSQLVDAVRTFRVPAGNGYVWFGGEASVGRGVRKYFRSEIGFPASRMAIVGYWRDDKEAWIERYERVADSLIDDYERMAATGMGEAEAEIHWDEILERAGL
ncbi:siderophore-interacting protein [Rhodococcoides fascians]|uniref:siderophore-interacting protein n=1 Tax=Rhodococcoides fascians TaxID=1828 RepID=UPI00050CC136|nr:siderophore-interacting protein [Rhodococcus fascians]AMY53518.1 NADPH-dependent ferric-chelate reductase [Rhodococcus fascians D188]